MERMAVFTHGTLTTDAGKWAQPPFLTTHVMSVGAIASLGTSGLAKNTPAPTSRSPTSSPAPSRILANNAWGPTTHANYKAHTSTGV